MEKWIIEYDFNIKNITPFEIGNEETETIKKDKNGNLVMFGSSLGGAIKSILNDTNDSDKSKRDFMGGDDIESKIIISDLVSKKAIKLIKRPGIKIDSSKGVTENKAKFTQFLVPKENDFTFQIKGEYLSKSEKDKFSEIISVIKQGFQNKSIQLGGNKSKGFGEFQINNIKKRFFNLNEEREKEKYFNYLITGNTENDSQIVINDNEKNDNIINYIFTGTLLDTIIIKGNIEQDPKESKKNIEKSYSEGEYKIIPSGTIKGSVKSFCEKVNNSIDGDTLGDTINKMFGNSKQKGLVTFYDVESTDMREVRYNRIKIDRFTGGTISNALLHEDRLMGDVTIKLRIENTENINEIKKLLLLYFRDLGMGKITIGSNASVGAGRFQKGTLKIDSTKEIEFFENGEMKLDNNLRKEIEELF